jgi:hypothetical protein
MMNPDGTIRAMTAEGITSLRNEGTTREAGPRCSVRTYRDISGLDERVWQHLLACADQVRKGEEAKTYNIGTQYLSAGKHPRLCTVTDILKTYNAAGELVRVRYQSTHELVGQLVTDHDVCATTIARGKLLMEAS